MFKGTPELISERREEIIKACEKLYQTMSFKEISLKEIGKATSFSRPTIYNYFQTKEEIFLALYEREYDLWNQELEDILTKHETLTAHELADLIARSLMHRTQLLKLLSMNNYDMEANSRLELLTSFKKAYGKSLKNIMQLLEKFCPDMTLEEIQKAVYVFFPFMFGLHPYAFATDRQRTAMKAADVRFTYLSVYELVYTCLTILLGKK
ncbi:MAG: TetR family transcriptional regulator [Desulfovibrio sp.]|nr:TetR family transcriptional regulator [Desulfovibrio sp.]